MKPGLEFENSTFDGQTMEQAEQTVLPEDIEINIDNTNITLGNAS